MRLDYEPQRNLLLLTVDERPTVTSSTAPGVLDMAAAGRLIGIETRLATAGGDPRGELAGWLDEPGVSLGDGGAVYIELTRGPDDEQARSAAVELVIAYDAAGRLAAIGIPRRGTGYEITYPSGNR